MGHTKSYQVTYLIRSKVCAAHSKLQIQSLKKAILKAFLCDTLQNTQIDKNVFGTPSCYVKGLLYHQFFPFSILDFCFSLILLCSVLFYKKVYHSSTTYFSLPLYLSSFFISFPLSFLAKCVLCPIFPS